VFSRVFCQLYSAPLRLRAGSLRAKVQAPRSGYFTAYVHTVSLPLLAIIFPCGFGGATGLSCGSSSFAKVTDERLISKTVVALLRKGYERAFTSKTTVALCFGHLALLVGRLSSVARLSLPT
jgi:hypothetical protein